MALHPEQHIVALSFLVAACTQPKPPPAVYEVGPAATPTPRDVAAQVCHDVAEELDLPPAAETTCTDALEWHIDFHHGVWPGPKTFPSGVSHAHAASADVVAAWREAGYVLPPDVETIQLVKEYMRDARVERGW